jgi:predicted nuclease of predicted toxin-antitoxin system
VKLLIDHNLSYKIAIKLQNLFPGSLHVAKAGLARSPDLDVWTYAKDHGFCILTKDEDFNYLSQVMGSPPKVIWLRIGNGPVEDAMMALKAVAEDIQQFGASEMSLLKIE